MHVRRFETEVLGVEHFGRQDGGPTAEADVLAHFAEEHVHRPISRGVGDLHDVAVALAGLALRKPGGPGEEHARMGARARHAHERVEARTVRPEDLCAGADGERLHGDVRADRTSLLGARRQGDHAVGFGRNARCARAALVEKLPPRDATFQHRVCRRVRAHHPMRSDEKSQNERAKTSHRCPLLAR